jgi:hypothetical protein
MIHFVKRMLFNQGLNKKLLIYEPVDISIALLSLANCQGQAKAKAKAWWLVIK